MHYVQISAQNPTSIKNNKSVTKWLVYIGAKLHVQRSLAVLVASLVPAATPVVHAVPAGARVARGVVAVRRHHALVLRCVEKSEMLLSCHTL